MKSCHYYVYRSSYSPLTSYLSPPAGGDHPDHIDGVLGGGGAVGGECGGDGSVRGRHRTVRGLQGTADQG